MRILTQLIIALSIILTAAFMLRGGNGVRSQALRRTIMMVFVLLAASSVFIPELWTRVANFLGIGRGTDLLLYALILVFLNFVASSFRHTRALERNMTLLARKIAIDEAVRRHGDPARKERDPSGP